jgi:hypothetical protein
MKKGSKVDSDPRVDKVYFDEIKIKDPVTGKITVKKVKIVRYKTVGTYEDRSVLDEDLAQIGESISKSTETQE